ncbi:MAG: excinuclease ABC subunit UvrB [Chlamydiota bacterium]
MSMFELHTNLSPFGDQPQAIERLSRNIHAGNKAQVLLGITGSGKTFTIANVIAEIQKPSLVIAHNKTLAAQLYQEFKNFFPNNAVEYFVSYYDYYQPEAYIPRTDTFIEKDMAINEQIERMRLSATRSLLERQDVLIIASVSCIYGLGSPEYYDSLNLPLKVGQERQRDDLLLQLVEMHYPRNDLDFRRGTFRVRGDIIEIFPAYEESLAIRLEFFGNEIEAISEIDPLTGKVLTRPDSLTLYPGSHFVTPEGIREQAMTSIRTELYERLEFFKKNQQLLELQRLKQRTMHDLEMIKEVGYCKGIENYSRHFSGREAGEPPPCLLDYFPQDYLIFIDESHQTLPQLHAMYNGDRARKSALVDFGFRLPSSYDNRPLSFEEFFQRIDQAVYVSATPSPWEVRQAQGEVIEQIIRPTGLLDPEIELRPSENQVDDCLDEIRTHSEQGGRVLVTTLTKRLAEELTQYLKDLGVKAKYLHSDIDTLERIQIIRELRSGTFDVLVGINLLREGLDIPEVSLVAILDADKEGFLRSETSLIQTCGRAARNAEGRVIMYADKITSSIKNTVTITQERRKIQEAYNLQHGITPQTVRREIPAEIALNAVAIKKPQANIEEKLLSSEEVQKKIKEYTSLMSEAAKNYNFEQAAKYRDLMRKYQKLEISLG